MMATATISDAIEMKNEIEIELELDRVRWWWRRKKKVLVIAGWKKEIRPQY